MAERIIIGALAENNIIGRNNRIPWHIGEDLLRFKTMTMGYPIIMGRKTWESIGCKPLPGRINIILSTQKNYAANGCELFDSLDKAIARHKNADKLFIIGGHALYKEGLAHADTLELTRIHKEVEGDVSFPSIDFSQWQKMSDIKNQGYSFVTYARKTT